MFQEIKTTELNANPFQMIGKDWLLITAQKDGKCNTMTASWGGLGVMWGKDVAFIVLRPQRYTKEFVDASPSLSICVLPERFRKEYSYLGSVSGRDEDKIAKAGLTVVHDGDVPYFEEAHTALICRKLYAQPYRPECFIVDGIDQKWYENDYHTMYICEIEKVLVKEQA